ncbi:MAG: signal peptidase I [Acidimicrobiia bacterium]|jgi:signal peptidase I
MTTDSEPGTDAAAAAMVDGGDGEVSAEAAGGSAARRSFWRELPILVLIALVLAVLVKTFAFQAFWIPSRSMADTLEVNDRVMVNKLAYRFGDVGRGDVIVFDDPSGPSSDGESLVASVLRNLGESVGLSTPKTEFIKRVVGLPGETLEIRDNRVLIDDVVIEEPYLGPAVEMADFGPVTVPEGELFVMGDNRASSRDSRFFGSIPVDDVVGRAFARMWPPSRLGGL